jgi:hypothetical protein
VSVLQSDLLDNLVSWAFIKKDKIFQSIRKIYSRNDDLSHYYDHHLASHYFKSKFYFDGSINIQKKDVIKKTTGFDSEKYYTILDLNTKKYQPPILGHYPKNVKIKDAQGSQGLQIIEPIYKVFWRYIAFDGFYFSKRENVLPMYQQYCIATNNYDESLFLFSSLNSTFNLFIQENSFKIKEENVLKYIFGLTSIKKFVRIPKITRVNQFIKDEIVKRTEDMLNLEDCQLQDFVDFSDITKQKFDSMEVRGNNLILTKDGEEYKAPIKKKKDVVISVLKEKFGDKSFLPSEIVLSELRYLMALDKVLQESLKDYIDDMVFALYFNVPVKKVGMNQAIQIKELCRQNEFYDYIQKEMQTDRR